MVTRSPSGGLVAAVLLTFASTSHAQLESSDLGGLEARAIGPAVMSGRVAAMDAVDHDFLTVYVGAASGGVWKSQNGGITFQSVFDEYPQSIGAIRIVPEEPETVWVGTGESWVRNSVSLGRGLFMTSDGGENWQAMGLEGTEHISTIRFGSDNGEIVYVCALGPAFRDSEQRGLFRSIDAGKSWTRVLYVDEGTGCADIDVDPTDRSIIYAAMWDFRRAPDFFRSGGPGSALFKSTDAGESWVELEKGLPEGELGRIAVAVAPSQPQTVYATVESENTALYRSDDGGESWTRKSDSQNVQMRPFYFSELVVDPEDAERVYKPGFTLTLSTDGGESFSTMLNSSFGISIHPDHHALWINPADPRHLILGTDGGVYISHDRAARWRLVGSLPISQFYHVSFDHGFPYRVMGGLQDNGSWTGPSRYPGGIRNRHWNNVGFGDGFWVLAHPTNENILFSEYQGGQLMRVDRSIGEIKRIAPVAEDDQQELRFNWNTPMALSPHREGRLYYGSQYLHVSDDDGESWQTISPDLSTNDPERQRQMESGGITIDNSTAENNATIYSISESPAKAGVIWVGTDDGLVHVSQDNGNNWREVGKNAEVPKGTWVSRVEASPFDPAVAFVTFDGHRQGDNATYVFRAEGYGERWTSLATDELEGHAWVIRQDLVNPNLLFLGTEFGLYASIDGGQHWAHFEENIPSVPVHDIAIHPDHHDVVVGTHGRGIFIIDDISPLRALNPDLMQQEVALLPSRPSIMFTGGQAQEFVGNEEFVGFNPPDAAIISYYQKKRHLFGDLLIRVYDNENRLITTLPASKRRGINRVAWPMRLPPPKLPPATQLTPGFFGPRVPEGRYRFELVKAKNTLEGEVELVFDPRSVHEASERALQQRASLELYNRLADLTYLVDSVTTLEQASIERADQVEPQALREALQALSTELEAIRKDLAASSDAGWLSGEQQLREKLGELYGHVSSFDGRPTKTQMRAKEQLFAALADQEQRVEKLYATRLPALNQQLKGLELPMLEVVDRESWNEKEGFESIPIGSVRGFMLDMDARRHVLAIGL